jgi:hypothetical protein
LVLSLRSAGCRAGRRRSGHRRYGPYCSLAGNERAAHRLSQTDRDEVRAGGRATRRAARCCRRLWSCSEQTSDERASEEKRQEATDSSHRTDMERLLAAIVHVGNPSRQPVDVTSAPRAGARVDWPHLAVLHSVCGDIIAKWLVSRWLKSSHRVFSRQNARICRHGDEKGLRVAHR